MAGRYNCRDPVHHALGKGDKEEILDFLKYKTVDLGITDSNGNTVLHSIIENKKLKEKEIIEISELLISRGINPNLENHNSVTTLHLAVANRMNDVVDLYIRHKADPNKRDSKDNLVTHYFIEEEYKKFTQKFGFEHADSHNSDDSDVEAMEIEGASFVEWLILKGFDFDSQNKDKKSAVYLAIEYNLQHILPVLLKYTKHIDYINDHGETLLGCFISRDYKLGIFFENFYQQRYTHTIVNILLDRGVSLEHVDYTERTVLQVAVEQDEDISMIDLLVNHFPKDCDRSNVATSRFYQIMCSCQFWNITRIDCYLKILGDLVAKGANVNYQDERTGTTPLYYAVKWKNLHAVKFLQENGANFQVKIKNGQNLLYQVVEKNCDAKWTDGVETQLEIFQILMNQGCEVNAVDEDGLSPLHLAARLKDTSILLQLIERGADVNCRTVNMTTPLHYSLGNPINSIDACEVLVDHGANVNAKNRWGIRPIHLVANIKKTKGVRRILNILLKRGAYVNALDEAGKSVLYRALTQKCTTAVIEEFLKCGVNVNENSIIDLLIGNYYYSWYTRDTSTSLLMLHWFKLDNVKLPSSVVRFPQLSNDIDFRYPEYREQCLNELGKLKAYKIDSRTSLYCLLHMHPSDRSAYVNNEELLSLVDSPLFEEQFPKYSVLILAAYNEAVAWKTLLQAAKMAWLNLTEISLPDICIELIFAYFNNAELIKVIEEDCKTSCELKLLYEKNF